MNMLIACTLGDWAWRIVHWLCLEDSSTAAVLLSMSFGVNSVFTGLSFSKYNIFSWIKQQALLCVQQTSSAEFLEKFEQADQSDGRLHRRIIEYSTVVNRCEEVMTMGSLTWEWVRRSIAICAAMTAFVLVAFECKKRMGFCLVLPYTILLVSYLCWVSFFVLRVKWSFMRMKRALIRAGGFDVVRFDLDACVNQLKAIQTTLKGDLIGGENTHLR